MSHLLLSYQKPCFWPVFKSKYIEEWVSLPMSSFIDAFVLEQRLQKLMVWKDLIFFTFLSILLLATCEGLRKAFFIYYYYYYYFVIFIFLFQSSNILSQEDILSKIYCHKNFFVFDIF